ncbi:hypothetical protein L1987_43524 [Smallanthus sonchifolius]|uniref:Uncharacterized protein n=1 Tax=Smallanthus sonchifolius TaxID=185202 RepID=A0ACB9GLS6_9ASTR|nr:hypothetical protein L1987_43524 [Smallanthus sonchifolius]
MGGYGFITVAVVGYTRRSQLQLEEKTDDFQTWYLNSPRLCCTNRLTSVGTADFRRQLPSVSLEFRSGYEELHRLQIFGEEIIRVPFHHLRYRRLRPYLPPYCKPSPRSTLSRPLHHYFIQRRRSITANVVDYKYSLQGLSKDTDQYTRILSEVHLRSAKRILKLCEMNQGFYIKAGQFVASVRQVPTEYSYTLASLQDQAVPCSFEAIKEVLISNLGSDLKEIFLSIDEQPIAAASIAQVHRALLKDHQEVVLKVDDVDYIREMGIDPRKVAKVLVEAFAEMIFVHGFVHGDPHPGNILVSLDEKQGFYLVLLDHGIYKSLDEEFRVNYCRLWKALVLLDSHKIQQVAQHFGIGVYAKYLPLIFTGRTINSKAAFGDGMSVEEKINLKQEVKSLSIGDISEFMESLPSEFLTVLRTDALVMSLTSKLGSSQRERLVVYANYALHDFVLKDVCTRIMSKIDHLQVRLVLELLQLLWWLRDTRQAVVTWSKQITMLINRLVSHHHTPTSVIS